MPGQPQQPQMPVQIPAGAQQQAATMTPAMRQQILAQLQGQGVR